tara:strand:+ start:814 stop:1095 length:282 start_codon:yes stop_codon:yes gene_type:complete
MTEEAKQPEPISMKSAMIRLRQFYEAESQRNAEDFNHMMHFGSDEVTKKMANFIERRVHLKLFIVECDAILQAWLRAEENDKQLEIQEEDKNE